MFLHVPVKHLVSSGPSTLHMGSRFWTLLAPSPSESETRSQRPCKTSAPTRVPRVSLLSSLRFHSACQLFGGFPKLRGP